MDIQLESRVFKQKITSRFVKVNVSLGVSLSKLCLEFTVKYSDNTYTEILEMLRWGPIRGHFPVNYSKSWEQLFLQTLLYHFMLPDSNCAIGFPMISGGIEKDQWHNVG